MNDKTPKIKGIFVNSHIKIVREIKGEEGVRKLEKLFGRSLNFRNFEDVPVKDEIRIIELALDLLSRTPVPSEQRAYEAGRLHFKDFTTTPFARIIFSMFRSNFKLMMLKASHIAGHVFKNVIFEAEDLGPNEAKIFMYNNDYPIDHFKGLFQEWMSFAGVKGIVAAKELEGGGYEYHMKWD